MDHIYSVIWFMAGKDTVWFNGRNNILFEENQIVPVRYQLTILQMPGWMFF